jgi:hypothetical protein
VAISNLHNLYRGRKLNSQSPFVMLDWSWIKFKLPKVVFIMYELCLKMLITNVVWCIRFSWPSLYYFKIFEFKKMI